MSKRTRKTGPTWSLSVPQQVPLFDPDLEALIGEEDEHSFLLSVREEILDRALDHCQRKRLEKSAVAFTVRCYREASLRMLSTAYMYYDKDILSFPGWENESSPMMSELDSYATCAVPITRVPKVVPVEDVEYVEDGLVEAPTKSAVNIAVESSTHDVEPPKIDEELPTGAFSDEICSMRSRSESSNDSFFTTLVNGTQSDYATNLQTMRCMYQKETSSLSLVQAQGVTSGTTKYWPKFDALMQKPPPLRLKGKFKSGKQLIGAPSSMRILF